MRDKIKSDFYNNFNSTYNFIHSVSLFEGNAEIENFIKQHFELPARTKNSTSYLSAMLYLSQVVQALCVKYESEHYRRLQDNLIDGKGYTMGALYWQLNDIWQGPSWSSIQYPLTMRTLLMDFARLLGISLDCVQELHCSTSFCIHNISFHQCSPLAYLSLCFW